MLQTQLNSCTALSMSLLFLLCPSQRSSWLCAKPDKKGNHVYLLHYKDRATNLASHGFKYLEGFLELLIEETNQSAGVRDSHFAVCPSAFEQMPFELGDGDACKAG